jgi:hypothetical protein
MFPQRWPMIFILEMDIFCQQDGADLFSACVMTCLPKVGTHGGIRNKLQSVEEIGLKSQRSNIVAYMQLTFYLSLPIDVRKNRFSTLPLY